MELCAGGLVVTFHSWAQRSLACTDTASCRSSAHSPPQSCAHTHTDSRLMKWVEPVGGASGEDGHLLVGWDPQWAGAARAGRPLAVQAAVAQEAALAVLAVLASRVMLTILEGEETGSGEPNLIGECTVG